MMTRPASGLSAATSGAGAVRSRELRPTRDISMSGSRQAAARACRSRQDGTPSPMFEGSGTFSSASQPFGVLTEKAVNGSEELIRERTGNRSLVLFASGDEVTVHAGEEGMRFLLVSGRPIEEPIAWYGPIVMNTQAELQRAFAELQRGTFLKSDKRK